MNISRSVSCLMFRVSSSKQNPKRETYLFMMVQSAHHPEGEFVGLIFGISPKNIVAHFMIDHVDPASFRFIFATFLPVSRMDQINLPIFISLAGGPAPVNILEPFHLRI